MNASDDGERIVAERVVFGMMARLTSSRCSAGTV
jgi:hypothetical protein